MGRERRAAEIAKCIGDILLNDWDPIGVRHAPEAQDEYDGYIGELYRLLVSRPSVEEVCTHLATIEEQSMGLGSVDPKSLETVASKLIKLNVRL
jgi:hypothetical protein